MNRFRLVLILGIIAYARGLVPVRVGKYSPSFLLQRVRGDSAPGQLFKSRRENLCIKSSKAGNILSHFTLDRSVLPQGGAPLYVNIIWMVLTAFASLAIKKLFEQVPIIEGAKNAAVTVGSSLSNIRGGFIPKLKYFSRVISGRSAVLVENGVEFIRRVLDINPAEELDIKDWNGCILDERELLQGGYMRYRFELKNPSGVLPLYIGQEVVMCAVDSSDKVTKDTFFPVSPPTVRGYFDIILRRGGESAGDKFGKTLDTMALGDEVAFKSGRYRLNYQGDDDPVKYTTIVASGLGITPALQMIRGVLPGKDTTVENIEMVWVNEEKSDFVCQKEVEALEYRYIDKFTVTRVVQTDLYGKDVTDNERVYNAISEYEPGRIGVVCGPDYVVTKVRSLFQELGYPAENVLSVIIP
eukprot:gene714-1375_t